eukprot:2888490-Pleurochrysis_carterae.AAC.1
MVTTREQVGFDERQRERAAERVTEDVKRHVAHGVYPQQRVQPRVVAHARKEAAVERQPARRALWPYKKVGQNVSD